MRNFAKKKISNNNNSMALLDHPLACNRRHRLSQKSFACDLISGSAKNIKKSLPREKFLSSTYVLVGKSFDEIVHEYFVQEARRSLYSFKT